MLVFFCFVFVTARVFAAKTLVQREQAYAMYVVYVGTYTIARTHNNISSISRLCNCYWNSNESREHVLFHVINAEQMGQDAFV